VIISKEFARRVREKNTILLSKVAIKARLDENGSLRGYEAVQIDKGSVVERMGFRPHDLVIGVNAIPARDLEASQESLESADRFDLTVVRKGKTIHLRFEIR
jgi:S1-C subfamily serine protease